MARDRDARAHTRRAARALVAFQDVGGAHAEPRGSRSVAHQVHAERAPRTPPRWTPRPRRPVVVVSLVLLLTRPFPLRPPVPHSFNRRQVDFNALKDYNDYLETVEDIIFNLCEGVDVRATEARVEAYRRENAAEIARLNQRNAEEDSRRRALAGAPAASHARDADAAGDPWAPRRMSNASDAEETPGPAPPGAGFGGLFGHTPIAATSGAGAPVLPVPAAVPVPSARERCSRVVTAARAPRGMGRRRGPIGGRSREERASAIALACGRRLCGLGAASARQEAFQSLFCF